MGLAARENIIYSEHFIGSSTGKTIISKGAPHISDPGRAPSFWFDNLCTANTWGALMSNSLTACPANDNNKFYIIVTSGNEYKVGKHDIGPCPQYEFLSVNISRWKDAGEGPNGVSYQDVSAVSKGLIMLPEKQLSSHPSATKVNLFVKPSISLGHNRINDIGRLVSEAANAHQRVRNWMFGDCFKEPDYDVLTGEYTTFNEAALKWTRYVISKGEDSERQILGIGTENLGDRGILARIYSSSYIVLSRDLYEKAWIEAEKRNLRGKAAQVFVEEYIGKVIAHEWRHSREQKRRSKNVTEAMAGEFEEEFYANGAEVREGTLKGRIYGMLSKISAAYASHYRSKRGLSGLFNRLKRMATKAKAEAEYMGMDDVAAANYVESRVREYADETEEELAEDAEGLEDLVDDRTDDDIEDSSDVNPREEVDDVSEEDRAQDGDSPDEDAGEAAETESAESETSE